MSGHAIGDYRAADRLRRAEPAGKTQAVNPPNSLERLVARAALDAHRLDLARRRKPTAAARKMQPCEGL